MNDFPPAWLNQLNRAGLYQAMLLDFIEAQAGQLAAQHAARPVPGEGVLPRLRHSLGLTAWPERTPLDARSTGRIARAGYAIEKVLYEARPGFTVTAHLYLPDGQTAPAPAVLYAPGHWVENGKLEPDIQICCANLARLGCVVLVYDPLGQGERFDTWRDHGHLDQLLVGHSQAGLMVWESMRAIDYLLSRPEVDARRIGMTGASGGGLNTLFTSAVDERLAVSVPVCFVTTLLALMTAERDRNWEDGVDLCNQVPGLMAYAELSDVCALFAPKPLCVIAGQRDWMFPVDGARAVFAPVAAHYAQQSAGDRAQLVEIDAEHGYSRAMREAAYGWLAHWLAGAPTSLPIAEVECELLPAPYPPGLTYMAPPAFSDLPLLRRRAEHVVDDGGLCAAGQPLPPVGPALTALTQQAALGLPPARPVPANAADWATQRVGLADQVQAALGRFPARGPVPDRFYNHQQVEGGLAERVVFESEPGIHVPALFLTPEVWQGYVPTVICLDEGDKAEGVRNGLIPALLRAGLAVFAIDVRGTGETAASDFEAGTNALMTDRPLLGQRVFDVLRAVDALWQRVFIGVQIDKGRIGCVGRGLGGWLALLAAALDERLLATVAWEAPSSFHQLIGEAARFPASAFLFDVLHQFDLPDVAALAAPRPLLLLNAVDGQRQPQPPDPARYAWPREVYRQLGAEHALAYAGAVTERSTARDRIVQFFSEQLAIRLQQ